MSKKRRGKKKKNKQTPPPIPPPPQLPPPAPNDPTRWSRFLTIVSIVLAIIGLVTLIELFPRLSSSASPPSDAGEILNSRFTISNDGYLSVVTVRAFCFISKSTSGNGLIRNSVISNSPIVTLHPSEAITVPCAESPGVYVPVRSADLAIVAYYRPWPFTFIHSRRFFRFVSRNTTKDNVTWDRQPSLPIEKDFDEFLDTYPDFKYSLEH